MCLTVVAIHMLSSKNVILGWSVQARFLVSRERSHRNPGQLAAEAHGQHLGYR